MFKQVFITREDGLHLLRGHLQTMSDQQLEDVLASLLYDHQLNFRLVGGYKNDDERRAHHKYLKTNHQ